MKKSIVLSFLAICLTVSVFAQRAEKGPGIDIVPRPVELKQLTLGALDLTKRASSIELIGADVSLSVFLDEFLKTKDAEAKRKARKKGFPVKLVVTSLKDDQLGDEGYKLSVSKKGISIQANAEAGLFYGIQTLIQLTNLNSEMVPYVEITDYPRFGYRGLHLDVCRHIFPVEFVKKYIDLMAKHKFNRFHWHLTDDQGWRIEIKKYPKLQQIAAYRNGTVIGHAGHSNTYDNIRYGGFYTQVEVKEVIAYAAARYVTIIPEIEMPGHAVAAIAAYPELGCRGDQIQTERTFGVFDPIFCAGQESTFTFLQDVLTEVADLFPGSYIHIGGDEAPKTRWKECPHCQTRIKDNNLKDEHELQSYFINRMEKFLNSKGKQIIGWDEILEGGLAPNATVMSWRGEEGGIAAAKLKHNVIMTPGNWCYFDHLQDTAKTEPLSIGGLTPVREVYTYEPLPAQLNADETKYILGAQANLWTEYILSPQHAEYMAYPRACALAEVVWSPKESRDYINFLQRMETHLQRLKKWNVNCATHIEKEIEYINGPGRR
jgi:hexosaminidase